MAKTENTATLHGGKAQRVDQIADDRLFCRGFLLAMSGDGPALDPFTRRAAETAAFAMAAGDVDAPMKFTVRYLRAVRGSGRSGLRRRLKRIAGYFPPLEAADTGAI